jgi:hypothetical protein
MRWAIVNLETNVVENVIIWDGNGNLIPYDTKKLIQLYENEHCGPGHLYSANNQIRFTEIVSEPESI